MTARRKPVIAIDGPVAAGKGTLARQLAAHFGYAHLDTGGLYRATALRLLRAGGDGGDAEAATAAARGLSRDDLQDPELRREDVGMTASAIAGYPQLRAALLDFQQNFAAAPPDGALGAVLEGRDTTTVVCPDADLKLYVTASTKARAKRRHAELQTRGESPDLAKIETDLRARDAADRARTTAPLKRAKDAYLLETSNLDIDGAFVVARRLFAARLGG